MSRPAERPLVYPKTEVEDVAETRFGTAVRDPYRWLDGLEGVPRLLLDSNNWSGDGTPLQQPGSAPRTLIGGWSRRSPSYPRDPMPSGAPRASRVRRESAQHE